MARCHMLWAMKMAIARPVLANMVGCYQVTLAATGTKISVERTVERVVEISYAVQRESSGQEQKAG